VATGSFGPPRWGSFHQGRGPLPGLSTPIPIYEFADRRAMSEPVSTVNITFQPPMRTNLSRCSSPHRRNLKGVPQSTAQQMAQDFTAYQHEPSAIEEKKLYTYQPSGQNAPPRRRSIGRSGLRGNRDPRSGSEPNSAGTGEEASVACKRRFFLLTSFTAKRGFP
jgi:hypothetical protein